MVKTEVKKNGKRFYREAYDSAFELVNDLEDKTTKCGGWYDVRSKFESKRKENGGDEWYGGIKTYEEMLETLRTGYAPVVDRLKAGIKANVGGEGKRIKFKNNVAGFQPIVPLALQGVPNCMVDTSIKPIKAKVIDVYYEMTVSAYVKASDIIDAGVKMLSAILELEAQGYKFNLYAVQSYNSDNADSIDMLTVKVKSANQPLDLKRISFPLTHPAFFRGIGFDWYGKSENTVYQFGYGKPLAKIYSAEKLKEKGKEWFGNNAVYFNCNEIIEKNVDYIKEVLEDVGQQKKAS